MDVNIQIDFDIAVLTDATQERIIDTPIATDAKLTVNGEEQEMPDLITLWLQQIAEEQHEIAVEARVEAQRE